MAGGAHLRRAVLPGAPALSASPCGHRVRGRRDLGLDDDSIPEPLARLGQPHAGRHDRGCTVQDMTEGDSHCMRSAQRGGPMKVARELHYVTMTPDDVLSVIRDSYRFSEELDPESEPGVDLTFASTVAEWRS